MSALSLRQWLRAHRLEVLLFAAGCGLRLSMAFTFDPMAGYDAPQHWDYMRWIVDHGKIPPVSAIYCGYHPPLYYLLSAVLMAVGKTPAVVQALSIVFGVIKLGLIWLGIEWYLKERSARLAALALAAVLPVALHMDGMLTNEVANGLFAVAAMVLVPKAFEAQGRRRWLFAGVIGFILALQLFSKISALMCIGAIGTGVILEVAIDRQRRLSDRIRQALPWALVLLVPLLLDGWYFARNVRDYGKPFVSSYDVRPEQLAALENLQATPYLDRRTVGFLVGFSTEIFEHPYYGTASGQHARFLSLLVAHTFVDYLNYRFADLPDGINTGVTSNSRPLTAELMFASRRSVLGGTAIALATTIAWLACVYVTLRRRSFGTFVLTFLPVLTVASALHFAIKYPFDGDGVVKASYMQFGMFPLYGFFGLAVAWTLRERVRWPLFVVLSVSLWLVAAYTLYCRFQIKLLPL